MPTPPNISIASLRGGYNDTLPLHLLPEDQCAVAENVEFFFSALGERRRGLLALDLTNAGMADEAAIVFLCKHNPTPYEQDAEFWGLGATFNVSTTFSRRVGFVWDDVTPVDAPDPANQFVVGLQSQTLHGKNFFAYKSGVTAGGAIDRTHVWDGVTLRRVGIAQPGEPPTVTNEGSGTYSEVRYFRVRFTKQAVDDTVLLRSEPSGARTFHPSGSGAGATITIPTPDSLDPITHWELEASSDGANFYRTQVTAIGTTTTDDETDLAVVGYADIGILSSPIGAYSVPGSAKYIVAGDDRMFYFSNWEDPTQDAQLAWTPVYTDPSGVGNDERIRLDLDSTLNLDTFAGGGASGLSAPVNGSMYAFKWSEIHKLIRTNLFQSAYSSIPVTTEQGAIPGSVVMGLDENGRGCVYFCDPRLGPSRIASNGLEQIRGLRNLWRRVNTNALVICRSVHYPDKGQIHWWLAIDGADTPNFRIVLQISEIRPIAGQQGVWGGWATATGLSAQPYTTCIFSEVIDEDGVVTLSFRPYLGFAQPYGVQRADVGTDDAGQVYRGRIRTRPYLLTGLLDRWGVMCGTLLAGAHTGAAILISVIRDFGLETTETPLTVDLSPVGTEPLVIKDLDDLHMSGARAIQLEFSDPVPV